MYSATHCTMIFRHCRSLSPPRTNATASALHINSQTGVSVIQPSSLPTTITARSNVSSRHHSDNTILIAIHNRVFQQWPSHCESRVRGLAQQWPCAEVERPSQLRTRSQIRIFYHFDCSRFRFQLRLGLHAVRSAVDEMLGYLRANLRSFRIPRANLLPNFLNPEDFSQYFHFLKGLSHEFYTCSCTAIKPPPATWTSPRDASYLLIKPSSRGRL
jgi:hypothetical protein